MWISKDFDFEAAHVLKYHPGKCSQEHGHGYLVRVEVHGKVNHDTGFIMDFGDLKEIVKPVIDSLDHRHLNDFIGYPSAENIATYIANAIQKSFASSSEAIDRFRVLVSETRKTWAIWDSQEDMDGIDNWSSSWKTDWRLGPPRSK